MFAVLGSLWFRSVSRLFDFEIVNLFRVPEDELPQTASRVSDRRHVISRSLLRFRKTPEECLSRELVWCSG